MNSHAEELPDARVKDGVPEGTTMDIAIIGGGIFGCALAHRAALAFPGRSIALFEQGAVGGGCSGFAGAIAAPAVRSELVRQRSDDSRVWYERYRREHPDAPMRELPILYVASERAIPALTSLLGLSGVHDGRDLLPDWLKTSAGEGVLTGPAAVWADVRALCSHLLARRPVVNVYEGARVEGYHRQTNGAWLLRLADGRGFGARGLVIAKGAWLDATERAAIGPMRNKKIVAFVIDMPAREDDAVVYLHDKEAFLLPLPARGCWLLSVVSRHWDCQPDNGSLQATSSDLATAVELLSGYAPTLLPALRGARVHCDGYLDDYLPRASAVGGAVCLHGASGSGFRYAPAVAAAALDALSTMADARESMA